MLILQTGYSFNTPADLVRAVTGLANTHLEDIAREEGTRPLVLVSWVTETAEGTYALPIIHRDGFAIGETRVRITGNLSETAWAIANAAIAYAEAHPAIDSI